MKTQGDEPKTLLLQWADVFPCGPHRPGLEPTRSSAHCVRHAAFMPGSSAGLARAGRSVRPQLTGCYRAQPLEEQLGGEQSPCLQVFGFPFVEPRLERSFSRPVPGVGGQQTANPERVFLPREGSRLDEEGWLALLLTMLVGFGVQLQFLGNKHKYFQALSEARYVS